MAVTLTADDRKVISRRIVKIPLENAAFALALANMIAAKATYLHVDELNKEFFADSVNLANYYESEIALKTGNVCGELSWETELIKAATLDPTNIFFPPGPPPYAYMIPKIVDQVNGKPVTAFGSPWEKQFTDNPASAVTGTGDGILQMADILVNGYNDGAAASSLQAAYVPGSGVCSILNAAGMNPGDRLYIQSAAHSAILVILTITHFGTVPVHDELTVYPIADSTALMNIGSGCAIAFGGFTQGERQSLVALTGAQQDVLDGLTNPGLAARVTGWQTNLNNQVAVFNPLTTAPTYDKRPTQLAQNVAELASINTALGNIAGWLALPNTGVGGKFDDTPIANLVGYATTRAARITTRINPITPADPSTWTGEVKTAIGGVVDNLDGTYTAEGGLGSAIWFMRYKFLDVRTNRLFGSYEKYYNADRGKDLIQKNIDLNNLMSNSSYTGYYDYVAKATQITAYTLGAKNLTLLDGTRFNAGDNIYIMDEDTAEVAATIQYKNGNIITLNIPITNSYNLAKLARIMGEI